MSNRILNAIALFTVFLLVVTIPVSAVGFGSGQPVTSGGSGNFNTATPTPTPVPVQIISTPVPTPITSSVSTQSVTSTSTTSATGVAQAPQHNGRITPNRGSGTVRAAALPASCTAGSICVVSVDSTASGSFVFNTFTVNPGVTLTLQGPVSITTTNDITIGGAVVSTGSNGGPGSDGRVFGGDGSAGENGGSSGSSLTLNAAGNVVIPGAVVLNGGNGGKGGDNECLGECHGNTGGSGGNGGSLDVRAAQFTLSGYINVNGGNGGPGGFGDGCDGHGGIGGSGGSAGSVIIRYITNTITGSIYRSGGNGGSGGGHDTDWYCRIDGYSGGDGPSGGNGGTGSLAVIQRQLATITVTPASATVASGSVQPYAAVGSDTQGYFYPVAPAWSVSNPIVGSFAPAAGANTNFTANATGTATVTATQASVSGTASVTVIPGSVSTIVLSSGVSSLTVGFGTTLTAIVTDAAGNPIADGTSVNFATTLGSVTPPTSTTTGGIATTTLSSLVSGTANATASSGVVTSNVVSVGFLPDVPASITLAPGAPWTVQAAGNLTVTAVVYDQYNNTVPGVTVTMIPGSSGTVSNSTPVTDVNGIVTTVLTANTVAGSYVFNATVGTTWVATAVNVVAGPTTRISILPVNPATAIALPVNLTAFGFDAYNNPTVLSSVWTNSSNLTVGSVQLTGNPDVVTFDPVGVGSAIVTITDSVTNVSNSSTVSVTAGTLTYIIINGPGAPVPSGANFTFTATGYDSFGNPIVVSPTWSVDNATVGTIVPATGVFTGGFAGTATINATQGNVSNTTIVSVSAGAPAVVYLSATPSAITAGGASTIDATVYDALGQLVVDGTNVSFVSSTGSVTPTVPTVGGVASATLTTTVAGVTVVNASSGTGFNQTSVSVNADVLNSLIVTPTNPSVASNTSIIFTANGFDQYGNAVNVTAANWTSSNTTIGTVTDLGNGQAQFDAMVAGTTVVTADAGSGISNTTQATVTPGTLSWIQVVPTSATLPQGVTQTFGVVGYDSFNNPVFVQANWTVTGGIGSVNPALNSQTTDFTATVNGTGSIVAFVGVISNSSSVTVTPNALPIAQGSATIKGVSTALFNGLTLNATTVDFIGFNSTSYDPDGVISFLIWLFGDNTTSLAQNFTKIYPSAGVYSAFLNVTDNNGAPASLSFFVNVLTAAAPNVVLNANATSVYVGDAILFDGSASFDPDGGPIVSYQWNFGDNQTSTAATVAHAYAALGSYPVSLTITDDEGWVSVANTTITVSPVPGTLSGNIVDSFGAPLNGVNVSLGAYSALTNSTGDYVIPGVPPGAYTADAVLANYYPANASVTINTGAVTTQNFTLTIIPGVLTGIVLDSFGAPLNMVNVSISGTGNWTLTNATGDYSITGVNPGSYTVNAVLAGYSPNSTVLSINPNVTTNANFVLAIIPGNVTGTVVDQDGTPLSGVNVSFGAYSALTSGTGAYSVTGVVPGAYAVSASRQWYLSAPVNATVAANSTLTQNFVLTIHGALNGTVRDADTGAFLNATMEVRQGGTLVLTVPVVNGLYWATPLLPGYYNLTANAPGYVYPLTQTNKQVLGGQNATVNHVLWVN